MSGLEKLHFYKLKTALLEKCLCKDFISKDDILKALEEVMQDIKECNLDA